MKLAWLVLWIAVFVAGIYLLKLAAPAGKSKRARATPKQKWMERIGWILTIAGGVGLAITFAILSGSLTAPPQEPL